MRRFTFRNSRLRGVLAIGGGALAGQLILVAATPLLSRLYAPDAFGAFSTLVAIATVVGPSAALKFDAGIVLPEDDRDAGSIARIALVCAVTISLLSAGVVWAIELLGLGGAWSGVHFAPLWMIALVFLTSLFTMLTQVALRRRAYGLVAKRSPIQSGAMALGQLGLGVLTQSPAGLLGGFVIGRVSGLMPMVRMTRQLILLRGAFWRQTLRSYWRLPVVLAPSGLLNSLGSQVPLLVIASLFGTSMAGEFSMAQRIVYIPATLVGASVAQVFAAELAKHIREGGQGATRAYLRSSGQLGLIAIPTALLIGLLGPWLLPIVLGPEWLLAGEFCRPLAVAVGISLVVTPTSEVYTIFQSVASLVVDLSRLLLLWFAIALSLRWGLNAMATAWVLVAAQAINYLFTWVYGIRVTRKKLAPG